MTATVAARQMQLSQWHRHTYAKFELKDADAALETMTDNPHVFCVPSGRGGTGKEGVRKFYADQFLPSIPPGLELLPISELVTIIRFENSKIASEHVYWGAAALLFQLRLINSAAVAAGTGSTAKLLKRAAQRPIQAEAFTLFA
jgi:carboxymethylenebutenolidase